MAHWKLCENGKMNCSLAILVERNYSVVSKVKELTAFHYNYDFCAIFLQAVEMSWTQKCARNVKQSVRSTISIWIAALVKVMFVKCAKIFLYHPSTLQFIEIYCDPCSAMSENEMRFRRVLSLFRMKMWELLLIKFGMAILCSARTMISKYCGNFFAVWKL